MSFHVPASFFLVNGSFTILVDRLVAGATHWAELVLSFTLEHP